ncbi:MAG: sigma-54-dependent Fis family transcriptional regulator [Myxococcaceae bacterium]|nr:sigma-54-dependent Fis family transcriptional regulator [Myxococcaceae bacterium]
MKPTSLRAVDQTPPEPTSHETAARGFARIVGSDAGLALMVQRAQLLTKVEAPLLLQGPTGVGKQLFARAVHEVLHPDESLDAEGASTHAHAPFVVLHCAGLPPELLARELFGCVDGAFVGAPSGGLPGKLALADGGTLFLDEIAELPAELQPYFLRVLESGEFYPLGSSVPQKTRFRLIAASSRDLRAEARAERFRMDLYFRISVTMVEIPPLHQRPEDVTLLVAHFADQAVLRHGLTPKAFAPEVLSAFMQYAWPGNVRELRSVVETLCLLTDASVIDLSMLPTDLRPDASVSVLPALSQVSDMVELPRGLQRVERAAIADALRCYQGNLTRVAQELQIARSTLYLKLKKYELEPVLTELRFGTR